MIFCRIAFTFWLYLQKSPNNCELIGCIPLFAFTQQKFSMESLDLILHTTNTMYFSVPEYCPVQTKFLHGFDSFAKSAFFLFFFYRCSYVFAPRFLVLYVCGNTNNFNTLLVFFSPISSCSFAPVWHFMRFLTFCFVQAMRVSRLLAEEKGVPTERLSKKK